MKIRTGFVSNSSSSSFCIYGTSIDTKRVEGIEKQIEEMGLEIHNGDCNYDNGTLYVGRSWSSIKDDETGAQFKEFVRKALNKFFGDTECTTTEQAWYDG